MQELINYFEALEARIAELEARVSELENRPAPEPVVVEKVVEKEVVKEVPVEVIKEVPVEKIVEKVVEVVKEVPVEQPAVEEPIVEEPVVEFTESPNPEVTPDPELPIEEPVVEQLAPKPAPIPEEPASPKAAIYGKAVDDIRLAISLGDRFLYQRELFGQNAELMQRTLTELNELHSFDEAIDYIASRFQWDTESSTYQQFLVTLHRRFG